MVHILCRLACIPQVDTELCDSIVGEFSYHGFTCLVDKLDKS